MPRGVGDVAWGLNEVLVHAPSTTATRSLPARRGLPLLVSPARLSAQYARYGRTRLECVLIDMVSN